MGAYKSQPFNEACFDDPRGLTPLVALMGGATIHYIITFIFIYWKNGKIGGIFKCLWAAVIFICAFIQLVLDYIVAFRYYAFAKPFDFPDRWQRYNCQIFLFSSNPNMIHMLAFVFCGATAMVLDESFMDNDSELYIAALYGLAAANLLGAYLSPQDGGLITHTFVGSILYIWFFLIFVIICGMFCCFGFYVVGSGDGGTAHASPVKTIVVHFVAVLALWCFLLYYCVVNNSMIDFYRGEHYIDAWINTWTEREFEEYMDSISGNWEREFSFWFMLLSVGG